MENMLDSLHGPVHAGTVPYITEVILNPRVMQFLAHDLLLELITAEDPDFLDTLGKRVRQEGMAKGAGTTGDKKCPECSLLVQPPTPSLPRRSPEIPSGWTHLLQPRNLNLSSAAYRGLRPGQW